MLDLTPEQIFICDSVAEGVTLREIATILGCTAGNVIRIATLTPQAAEHYARCRDAAADLFEADVLEAARAVTGASAAADRVKIDALKWIAARRAPKRYGDRVQTDHTSSDGSMTPKEASTAVLDALARKHKE